MKISGGAMLGNCATGKVTIVIAPTTTVRIAITIATIGRFMKNLDMALLSLRSVIRRGIYHLSVADFFRSNSDDAFSRSKTCGDHPRRAGRRSHLDLANLRLVISSDDDHLIAAL